MNKIIKLETPEDKIKRIKIKETIRNGLDELNILKINRKKELEEIESKSMILKENERMARFKIEEIKELEIELKGLESELKFKKLILKKLGLF